MIVVVIGRSGLEARYEAIATAATDERIVVVGQHNTAGTYDRRILPPSPFIKFAPEVVLYPPPMKKKGKYWQNKYSRMFRR